MNFNKKVKLESCYLMIVLKYLDSIDTLKRFNLVCKSVQTAIDATRINPCCGIHSLPVALTLQQGRIQKIEMKAFNYLDTYQVHFREIEKLHEEELNEYKMIEIYKYLMLDKED